MKKLMIGAFALVMCTVITSCNQTQQQVPADNNNGQALADSSANLADSHSSPIDTLTTDSVDPNSRHGKMIELAKLAQKEGKSWSVEQWKAHYKEAMKIAQPTLKKLEKLNSDLKENPNSIEAFTTLNSSIQEFEECSKLMEIFQTAAEATGNGKAAMDDKAWKKKLLKELGLKESI